MSEVSLKEVLRKIYEIKKPLWNFYSNQDGIKDFDTSLIEKSFGNISFIEEILKTWEMSLDDKSKVIAELYFIKETLRSNGELANFYSAHRHGAKLLSLFLLNDTHEQKILRKLSSINLDVNCLEYEFERTRCLPLEIPEDIMALMDEKIESICVLVEQSEHDHEVILEALKNLRKVLMATKSWDLNVYTMYNDFPSFRSDIIESDKYCRAYVCLKICFDHIRESDFLSKDYFE